MSGSIYGKTFTISTFGESHGKAVGVVVDGVTPGIELSEADIQKDLDRLGRGMNGCMVSPDLQHFSKYHKTGFCLSKLFSY